MKPLIVGQAPGQSDRPGSPALGGGNGAGGRLAAILGVRDVRELFDTVNLLDAFPGRLAGQSGDIWPLSEARGRARALDLSGRPFVILLGLNVARAFGVPPLAFEWFALPMLPIQSERPTAAFVPVAVVPHTSGVNRFYNDPEAAARVRTFLRDALQHGPVYGRAGV